MEIRFWLLLGTRSEACSVSSMRSPNVSGSVLVEAALAAVAAVVWWPHACASLQWLHFGGTQSRGLALLRNHCVANPSSIMVLGEAVCSSPTWKAWKTGCGKTLHKSIPKREPRLRRKGPPPWTLLSKALTLLKTCSNCHLSSSERLTLSAPGSRGTLKEYTQQQGEEAATWKCLLYLKFKSYFQWGFPFFIILTSRQCKYLFALKSSSLDIYVCSFCW